MGIPGVRSIGYAGVAIFSQAYSINISRVGTFVTKHDILGHDQHTAAVDLPDTGH